MSATTFKLHGEHRIFQETIAKTRGLGFRLHRLWQAITAGGGSETRLFAGQEAAVDLHLATLRRPGALSGPQASA